MSQLQHEALKTATADPARIHAELRAWRKNPDAYIRRRFAELREWDFPVWAAGNIKIQSKAGRRVPLLLNRVQRRLWEWLLEDLVARRPVRWFVLKARQEGVSTFVIALFLWLSSLRPDRNALICAHDEAATQNFNSRLRSMLTASHPLLQPDTVTNRRDLVHFGKSAYERRAGSGVGLDSRLVFATAQRDELGTSYNFHAALLSEVCKWPQVGIDVARQLGSFYQTISDAPGTIIIFESSAVGENEATQILCDPKNGYRQIFISYVAYDDYRLPPSEPLELSMSDDDRYGNETEEARLIRRELETWYPEEIAAGGDAWTCEETLARLNWRRATIDGKCLGDLTVFRHEYPACPAHALSTRGKTLFDSRSLELLRGWVETEDLRPVACNYLHDTDEGHPNAKFKVAPRGRVKLYRLPGEFDEHDRFVIGCDTSMGLSPEADHSAAVVLHIAPDGIEECASFSAVTPPEEFAELLYYLASLYNRALLGVEFNDRGGSYVNTVLAKRLRYPRLYYQRDLFTAKRKPHPGFVTTAKNKSDMIADLAELIRDHGVIFRNPDLLDQLGLYRELKDGKFGAPSGYHDDLVSAALIAVFLAGKVHQFLPEPEPLRKGTFRYEAERLARSRGLRIPGV